jgi:hypothetical protein
MPQLAEYPGQLLTWNMKERCVGKDTVKVLVGKYHAQKVLMQNFTSGMLSCYLYKILGALQSNSNMAKISEVDQVSSWPTTQVQDRMLPGIWKMAKQSGDVLAHVVVTCALPKRLRAGVVMAQSTRTDLS